MFWLLLIFFKILSDTITAEIICLSFLGFLIIIFLSSYVLDKIDKFSARIFLLEDNIEFWNRKLTKEPFPIYEYSPETLVVKKEIENKCIYKVKIKLIKILLNRMNKKKEKHIRNAENLYKKCLIEIKD